MNEVNIGPYPIDVLVYFNLGDDEQAVGGFRIIYLIVDQPMTQIALRVEVDAQYTFVVAQPETDGEILSNSGLTGATLLIDEGDDPQALPLSERRKLRPCPVPNGTHICSGITSARLFVYGGESRQMLQNCYPSKLS